MLGLRTAELWAGSTERLEPVQQKDRPQTLLSGLTLLRAITL